MVEACGTQRTQAAGRQSPLAWDPGDYLSEGRQRGRRDLRASRAQPRPHHDSSTKPGLFASKGEKQLYKAVKAQDAQAIQAVGDEHLNFRLPAYSLAGLDDADERPGEATRLLSRRSRSALIPARTNSSGHTSSRNSSSLSPAGVTAELPINRDAVGLALAELKQEKDDCRGSNRCRRAAGADAYAAVSLAELYSQIDRQEDVVELTEGIKNEDDATASSTRLSRPSPARAGLPRCGARSFQGSPSLSLARSLVRHLALSERASNYEAQGKKGMARKDLERILAEDSSYEGVREQLAEL